jgi:polyisoprenoid-binding protein YceI
LYFDIPYVPSAGYNGLPPGTSIDFWIYNLCDYTGDGSGPITINDFAVSGSGTFVTLPDTEAPVITLIGDNPLELNNGDVYTDPGVSITDNHDYGQTLQSALVVGGDVVDTSVDGTYTVTYNVSDSSQNAATEVTRVVNVTTPFTAPTWAGDWTLDPVNGSLQVGWDQNNIGGWWNINPQTVALRACLYDDVFSFGADGTFTQQQQGSTWLETWQGEGVSEGCGTPIAPHDGSNAATYTYDANTITVNGNGAYLGLSKVHNNGEDGNSGGSITYNISSVTESTMVVNIQYATPDQVANNQDPNRTWQFKLRKVGSTPPAVTLTVNTANITVGTNGMYLGGGVFGDAQAFQMSDADADGTYEVTVNLAEGTSGNYIFLNSPNDGGDWSAKENLAGQSCGDSANFNDRILAAVGSTDYTLQHCFGSCETDGTCPVLDPEVCAPVPTQLAADVIPVFSDAYANNIVTDIDPNWGQGTDATQVQIGPNSDCNVLKYAGLSY